MGGEVEASNDKIPRNPAKNKRSLKHWVFRWSRWPTCHSSRASKKLMGKDSGKFHRALKVTSARTQQAYGDYVAKSNDPKTVLFWHGSRNENWLSIMKSGLVLRPANAIITGKTLGYGLYLTDKLRKLLNYSLLRV